MQPDMPSKRDLQALLGALQARVEFLEAWRLTTSVEFETRRLVVTDDETGCVVIDPTRIDIERLDADVNVVLAVLPSEGEVSVTCGDDYDGFGPIRRTSLVASTGWTANALTLGDCPAT